MTSRPTTGSGWWRAKHLRGSGDAQTSRGRRWSCPAERPCPALVSLNRTCAFTQLVSQWEPLLMEMSLAQPVHTGPRRLHFQCTPLKSFLEPSPPQLLTLPPGRVSAVLKVSPTPGFPAGIHPSSCPAPWWGPPFRQTSPPPPAAIAGRKFGVCSSGEPSVSKQSSFQNRTKQRQSFPCELEFNHFESLNLAQLDKIKMFCPDFNYPLLLNYFIYITVYYAQAF